MRGIMCSSTAKTNEEYRKVIHDRLKIFAALTVIGFITISVALFAKFLLKATMDDRLLGIYTGLGTGLFGSGIILWIKNRLLLNNDEKLKESRLNNTDERIQEIANRAFRAACFVLLATLYAITLIGGLFYPILFKFLLIIVTVFLFSYLAAYKYYSGRM